MGNRLGSYGAGVEPSDLMASALVTSALLAGCGLSTTGGVDRLTEWSGRPASR